MSLSQLTQISETVLGTYGMLGLQDLHILRSNHPSFKRPKVSCSHFTFSTRVRSHHTYGYTQRQIPTLPQEIHDLIIDFLHDDHLTLRTCLLVCKAWGPAIRYHLYDSFRLHYYDVSERDVEDALQSLHKVQQWHDGQGICDTRPLPNLRPLVPYSRIPRRLSIVGDRCSCVSEEWLLPLALRLHQFPSVTNLELDDIEWEDVLTSRAWAIFTGRSPAPTPCISTPRRRSIDTLLGTPGRTFCSQITSLFLGSVDMKPFRPLRDVITAFPRLEKLELFPTYVSNDLTDDSASSDVDSEDEFDNDRRLPEPPPFLHTLIAEASPGEFILRPFFRWLTCTSFTGLRTIRLGTIGREDIRDFVEHLEIVGPGLKELSVGFDTSSGVPNEGDNRRLSDLELFTSLDGLSKNTNLVTLEINGLFEIGRDTESSPNSKCTCTCQPVAACPSFLRTIHSPALETLVLPISRASSTQTKAEQKQKQDRWTSIDSFLSNPSSFPVLSRVRFIGPRPEKEVCLIATSMPSTLPSTNVFGIEMEVEVDLSHSRVMHVRDEEERERVNRAFNKEVEGVVRERIPGVVRRRVFVYQGVS